MVGGGPIGLITAIRLLLEVSNPYFLFFRPPPFSKFVGRDICRRLKFKVYHGSVNFNFTLFKGWNVTVVEKRMSYTRDIWFDIDSNNAGGIPSLETLLEWGLEFQVAIRKKEIKMIN